jgi:NhaA family Na+:H+ antiporter
MASRTLSTHPAALPSKSPPASSAIVRFIRDRYLLLPIGALIAVLWANLAPESYFRIAHDLAFPVNEIGMAFFLALMAQEALEAVMPGGALHSWRRWSVPVVAAAGGIAGAAGVYLWWVGPFRHEAVLADGWPIATAIDLAAGYYVLKLIGARRAVVAFFLILAIATDAFGMFLVTIRPGAATPSAPGILLMLLALGAAGWMSYRGVRAFTPYVLVAGAASWWACWLMGVHPALALVPIVPFLPREPRRRNVLEEAPDDDDIHHAEHQWNTLVQLVLFFFGLVNAGVLLKGWDTGTFAVLGAALIGRPIGVLAGIGIAVAYGLWAPKHVGWREFVVIALATTSGFTFALFFATSVLPMGAALAQLKMGALLTVAGALVTIGVARGLGVGRAFHVPAAGR